MKFVMIQPPQGSKDSTAAHEPVHSGLAELRELNQGLHRRRA
jgi:hypothetical protein